MTGVSKRGRLGAAVLCTLLGASGLAGEAGARVVVNKTPFGKLDDGTAIELYTLTSSSGSSVSITNLGAIIVSMRMPDRNGKLDDIVLGFDSPQPYLTQSPYFGAVVGRYANRIRAGKFSLDGTGYTLPRNNGENSLHGGTIGFDKRLWQARPVRKGKKAGVRLSLLSADGDQGYPGALNVTVTYMFDDANRLTVTYDATTTKPTVVNLSQHSYFNLNGQGSGPITDHHLRLAASHFTPTDAGLIPTGAVDPVEGTPMDFRHAKPIGRDIGADYEPLRLGGGYDHNWVLDRNGPGLVFAASLSAPKTGRRLEIYTDQPAIQFYAGNFLDGTIAGKNGARYVHRSGLCLETQHYPDSPNQPTFPTTVLRPGQSYHSVTEFRFSTE